MPYKPGFVRPRSREDLMPGNPNLPTCSRCKARANLCNPLFRCTGKKGNGKDCRRYYHAACHSPHPRSPIDWKCRRCAQLTSVSWRYNESSTIALSSQPLGSPISSSIRPSGPAPAPASAMTRPQSSVVIDLTGSAIAIQCSMPKCSARVIPGHVFCPDHAASVATIGDIVVRAPTSASASAARNKVLPDHTRDRHTARKTASNSQPPFKSAASPPVRDSTTLPILPIAQAHPQTFQSQGSPPHLRGGEPPRKRPRLSPELGLSPEPRQNGVKAYAQPKAEAAPSNNSTRPPSAQTIRSAFDAHPRLNRPYETKPVFKLSAKAKPPSRKQAPSSDITPIYVRETLRAPEQSERYLNGYPAFTDRKEDDRGSSFSRSSGSSRDGRNQPNGPTYQRELASAVPVQALKSSPQTNGNPHYVRGKHSGDGCNYEKLAENQLEKSRSAFWEVVDQPSQPPAAPATPAQVRPEDQVEGLKRAKASKAPGLLEKLQQESTSKAVDQSLFDNILYSQEGAAPPPPGVVLPSPAVSADANAAHPLPPDEPFFADIDPRIHWPQRHSEAWRAAKLEEIKARGGRKAWLGKAPQRIRQQRQQGETASFEETLPDKIRDSPAWLRALKRLNGVEDEAAVPAVDKPVTTRGRKPGMGKRQANHVNGNGNGVHRG